MKKEERKRKDEAPVSIEESSGNVFADLGLKNPEELLAKAELVHRVCDIIAERKLTQVRAAKLLGIDQPKISALMRGKLDGFSLDRLFRFLNALGSDVEISIRPARQAEDAERGSCSFAPMKRTDDVVSASEIAFSSPESCERWSGEARAASRPGSCSWSSCRAFAPRLRARRSSWAVLSRLPFASLRRYRL